MISISLENGMEIYPADDIKVTAVVNCFCSLKD